MIRGGLYDENFLKEKFPKQNSGLWFKRKEMVFCYEHFQIKNYIFPNLHLV